MDAATPASDVYSLGKTLFWLLTPRRLMVREAFDSAILAFDQAEVRGYLARLVRRCVLEDPAQRVTAPALIEAIDWTFAKLDEQQTWADEGLMPLTDNYGPDSEVNIGGR